MLTRQSHRLKDPTQHVDGEDVRQWLRQHLGGYQIPKKVSKKRFSVGLDVMLTRDRLLWLKSFQKPLPERLRRLIFVNLTRGLRSFSLTV